MKKRPSHNSMNNEQLLDIYCAQHCCEHVTYLLLRTACNGGAEVKQLDQSPSIASHSWYGSHGSCTPSAWLLISILCGKQIHHIRGKASRLRQVSKKKIHRQFLFLLSSILKVIIIEECRIYKNMLRQKISVFLSLKPRDDLFIFCCIPIWFVSWTYVRYFQLIIISWLLIYLCHIYSQTALK